MNFDFFMQNLLFEKILLLTPSNFRGDYPKQAVTAKGISIRMACQMFDVSETCYRYEAKHNAENEQQDGELSLSVHSNLHNDLVDRFVRD